MTYVRGWAWRKVFAIGRLKGRSHDYAVICSWCKRVMWAGTRGGLTQASHGICEECARKHFGEEGS